MTTENKNDVSKPSQSDDPLVTRGGSDKFGAAVSLVWVGAFVGMGMDVCCINGAKVGALVGLADIGGSVSVVSLVVVGAFVGMGTGSSVVGRIVGAKVGTLVVGLADIGATVGDGDALEQSLLLTNDVISTKV